MNYGEVILNLSKRLNLSQRETRRLLKTSIEVFKKILDKDISFTLPKFGTFGTRLRQKRKAFNPFHEKFMMLPPKRVVFFHPSSVLKKDVKDAKVENES